VSPPVSALKAPLSYETNEDLSDKKCKFGNTVGKLIK